MPSAYQGSVAPCRRMRRSAPKLIGVYTVRFTADAVDAIREIAQLEDRPPTVVVRRLALAGLKARTKADARRRETGMSSTMEAL